jgi:ABC-type transport system substrate-binding protein
MAIAFFLGCLAAAVLLPAVAGAGPPPTEPPPVRWPADLAQAAAKAPPATAELFRSLAVPIDEVTLPDGSRQRLPLPARPGAGPLPSPPPKGALAPYEEAALSRISAFLGNKDIPELERVRAAEEALAVVLRFHLAVRAGPLGNNPWQGLEGRLTKKLRDVRLQHLQVLAAGAHDEESWAGTLAYAAQLAELYPESKRVKVETAAAWARYAEDRVKAGAYPAARVYLDRINRLFLHHPQARDLERALAEKAAALVKEAHALQDKGAAIARLEEAQRIWPRLPGLRDELLRRQGAYLTLYVGVASLPERLSPATAWTDSERQAVELLFERLVHEVYDDRHGERYRPGLTAGLPEAVSGGRRCRLRADAYWPDGQRVTAADVRHTALLLGRSPTWADLVEPPSLESDPFRIDFRFRKCFLDPLAPLSFHVLPQTLTQADDPGFAKAPVGCGPFQYAGRKHLDGRDCAVFVANPQYGWRVAGGEWREPKRSIGEAQPYIREIRFTVSRDPVRDFQDAARPLHLLLDVPAERIKPLRQAGVAEVRTLENRRVYFLAVSHRVAALQSQALRRALAHSLDRDAILTACFRGGHPSQRVTGILGAAAAVALAPLHATHPDLHRTVNSPYPPKSWACALPSLVPAELLKRELAQSLLGQARDKEGVARAELTLKYPNDDPPVDLACREMARQWAALGDSVKYPLHVKLVPLPPHELRRALESGQYDLAYHHIDYPNEAYWLGPLFDDRPEALKPGGSNYLGYQNDARLVSLFRSALGHRDFARVQQIAHDIREHLNDRMPLIPLWQLDTVLAVHPDLTMTDVDPLLVFGDVAQWQLKGR